MIVELRMLVASAALLFVLVFIQAQAGISAQGFAEMAGNRDGMPPPTGFAGRSRRTVDNHIEGMAVFAPLLIAAVLSHRVNHWTAIGSQFYFYGRLVHAPVYLLGLPWIRSLAYMVCVAGMAFIFLSDVGVL
jgi:uncharacterized MAPEG superfamily protein